MTAAFFRKLHTGRADQFLTLLFYIGWTMELVVVIIDKSALVNPYESYIFRVTFALFALLTICNIDRFDKQQIILLLFAAGIGFIDYRACGQNVLLRAVVFISSCRQLRREENSGTRGSGTRNNRTISTGSYQNISKAVRSGECVAKTSQSRHGILYEAGKFRVVMKYTLFFTAAGCLMLVFLSLFGILGDVSLTQDYGHGMEKRYVLGLGHPNALHCMACMLILLALYLYGRQKTKARQFIFYGGLFLFNLLLYRLTKSNSAFVVAAGGIILSFLLQSSKISESVRKTLYLMGEVVLLLGLIFSFLGAVVNPEGKPWMEKIDRLLTGRVFSLWDTTFHEGTLSTWRWFGSQRNTSYFFDMGFIRFVYWYGVIPAVLLLILIFWLLRQMRRRDDAAAFVLLLMCCIYTIPEAHLVSVYLGRNYCLLLAAAYLQQGGAAKDALPIC